MQSSTTAAAQWPRVGSIVGGAIALAYAQAVRPAAGGVAQVKTITVSTPTAGSDYGYTLTPPGGSTQTITATAPSTTISALIALIVAAHKANAYANGAVSVSSTSTTIVLTERLPGATASTIAEVDPDAKLSIADTTAGADAGTFTFGRFAPISLDSTTGEHTVAQPSVLAGPVLTLTQTHDASGNYALTVTVTPPSGAAQTIPVSWAHGANAAATDTAAVTALNSALGSTVQTAAVSSTGVVTSTWPVGYTISYTGVTASGGSAALSAAVTAGAATPLPGLILRTGESSTTATATARTATIAGTSPLCLYSRPASPLQVTVEDPGAAVTAGNPVWIDSTTGAPRASAAPGRYMHPTLVWVVRNVTDLLGATVAVAEAR